MKAHPPVRSQSRLVNAYRHSHLQPTPSLIAIIGLLQVFVGQQLLNGGACSRILPQHPPHDAQIVSVHLAAPAIGASVGDVLGEQLLVDFL